jgi:hypothetical protein
MAVEGEFTLRAMHLSRLPASPFGLRRDKPALRIDRIAMAGTVSPALGLATD